MHTAFVKLTDDAIAASPVSVPGGEMSTPAIAGFCTGLLYKSASGSRGALLAGTIGAVVSTVYWYGGSFLYNNINKKTKRW